MKAAGLFFLPWVQEVIRNEEVAIISWREFWPQIVEDQLVNSNDRAHAARSLEGAMVT